MKRVLVVGALFLLSGCASQDLYESIQASNRFECDKLPPSQYEACIAQTVQPYDDYDRERRAIESDEN